MQRVEPTEAGERAFLRLRDAAVAFDARIRAGLSDEDLDRLREPLATLDANSAAR